jgi:hypothetical protein
MLAAMMGAVALVGVSAGTAKAVVDARADVEPLAIKGSTITIRISQLLANDLGKNKQFLSIKKFGPQKASIGFIKRQGDRLFIHINSFAVADANGFVNLRYSIKGKGGSDSAFVRIPIGAVSST